MFLDLIVTPNETDDQSLRRNPEERAQSEPDPTLEQIVAEFSNPQPCMLMRMTENVPKLEQLKNDVGSLVWRQCAELLLHAGIDEQRFFQEPPSRCQAASQIDRRVA